jgi:membrane-associated phospholipid phosphatase
MLRDFFCPPADDCSMIRAAIGETSVRRTAAIILCVGLVLCAITPASAKTDNIEKAGQAIAIILPVAAGGITIFKSDWTGLAEVTVATAATVGTAYGLKYVVHEERPDHSDNQSFPSDTSALAFAPADFLWQRYGWQYGVPAYLAAAFVGYSRVESKQHHWWDVAASAGIAFGYNEIFTTRYVRPHGFYSGLYGSPQGAFLQVGYTW